MTQEENYKDFEFWAEHFKLCSKEEIVHHLTQTRRAVIEEMKKKVDLAFTEYVDANDTIWVKEKVLPNTTLLDWLHLELNELTNGAGK